MAISSLPFFVFVHVDFSSHNTILPLKKVGHRCFPSEKLLFQNGRQNWLKVVPHYGAIAVSKMVFPLFNLYKSFLFNIIYFKADRKINYNFIFFLPIIIGTINRCSRLEKNQRGNVSYKGSSTRQIIRWRLKIGF